MTGKLADSRGRRGALLLDTWMFLIGGVLQTLAWNMTTIIVSRFIIGFASGFSSVLVPIYLGKWLNTNWRCSKAVGKLEKNYHAEPFFFCSTGELAPPTLRGMLGT